MQDKLKVFFHSDSSFAKTGFGRNARAIINYLHETGKYEIVQYCMGCQENTQQLKKTPWRSIGCLPADNNELAKIQRDPSYARQAGYGAHFIDKAIKEEKPDVYFGVQDIWGVDYCIEKPWFNKINHAIWTTLDSLPILPNAVEKASKIKNYWIWADFATKALHELGHKHVKTIRGALDTKHFYKVDKDQSKKLRKFHGIDENTFVVGFVFRNQLRKSVPNLLLGFKKFKQKTKNLHSAKLLLHTHFSEGWDIPREAKNAGVSMGDILCTYTCRSCKSYFVSNFKGQDQKCPLCGSEKGLVTANTQDGVTEAQLNEIYNLMDVYVHPFTSGGQEIPIQEAKLCELITLVTNYSCGEDLCVSSSGSMPLKWTEYWEPQTHFIKATTDPDSIASNLSKVYRMPVARKSELGKKSRKFVIDNFSVEVIGGKIEEFLDGCEKTIYDFNDQEEKKDPYVEVPEIQDDEEWILWLYHNILKMKGLDKDDDGFKYWKQELTNGKSKKDIENYFREVAAKENFKNDKNSAFEESLDKEDKGKRIAFVMPEAIGDLYLCTSLFKSIKDQYPDYNLYVCCKPEFSQVLQGNPYIHKVINYIQEMDDITWLEGKGDHEGYFEIAFMPYVGTQRFLNYMHNGKDKIAYKDLKYES